jgi:acetyl-CoA synthetase
MAQEWVWQPKQDWVEETNVWRWMQKLGFTDREAFLAWSREKPEEFWDALVRETGVDWFTPYTGVLDTSRGVEWSQWCLGGRLNIAHKCLDRHASSGKIACLWEGEDGETRSISFAQLKNEVNALANGMKELGLREGDRIALVMPMVPEVVTILYAAFKLGLIVVPIFAGFGAGAIATRLEDSDARVVFTADSLERRGKRVPLKEKVEHAIERGASVDRMVVLRYRGGEVNWSDGRDIWWSDLLAGSSEECPTLPVDSESRCFILYTSGTTGKPKGAVHTHAGCLAQMGKEIYLGFDHKETDRFWWLSDIGWMMGPWTIIGNHLFGGTIFLYDGAPDYPGPERLWQMVERHRITTLGISPTAIRLLMKYGDAVPDGFRMETLRLLGSTGEPWDDTSYMWYFDHVGKSRCPIINISGGTEIVGSFLFPLPIQPLKSCTLGSPAPGIATECVDDEGRPVRGRKGYLVCTRPVPSMTRGVWRSPERYLDTYWSRWKGYWYHGDWASVDEDGHWFVHGRADESMNVAGRKVGPAEVEEALMEHPAVREAAVIGVPDDTKGECIVAFLVTSREFTDDFEDEVAARLVEALGPTFRPKALHAVPELPKTQSGKIVRRLIRQKYLGENLGDLSTVENPGSLEAFTRPS